MNIGYVDEINLSTYDNQVVYIKKCYSYNFLLKIKTAISDKMLDYSINTVGLNEESNEIDVCIADQENYNLLISYLEGINLYYPDAMNIIIDQENKIIPHAKTAYGGDKINDSVLFFLNSYGTICVNAYDNETGKYGVLTNAHIAEANTTMYHNGNILQGSKLGTTTKRKRSGSIDAAFVPFENQDDWQTTTYARSGNDVYNNIKLGSRDLIIQGAPIRRLGQTTGNTTGYIESTNYDCLVNYDGDLVTIYNTLKYSTNSNSGDSGGPVYFDGGGQNLFLIGMHFAGPADSNLMYGFGCNIFNVIDEFNITPILNGTIYETTDLNENEIRIDKLNPIISFSSKLAEMQFEIPTYLNGKLVTEIGAAAFENQVNITEFILPSNLKIIGNSAFKNCNSLQSIVIPNTVTDIGSNAFEDCRDLTSITIPSSVTNIDSSAFKDCESLINVYVERDTTLTNIGTGVFSGCTSLDKIIVPISKIFRYRNDTNWSTYINLLECAGSVSEYNFHCRTNELSFDRLLENGETLVYALNIECPIQYRIDSESNKDLVMNIYDENMTLVENALTTTYENTHMAFFVPLLSIGKYYIEVYYNDEANSGTVLNKIRFHTSTADYITTDDEVDVLTHLHDSKNEFLITPKASGLFLLELEGIVNNEQVNPKGEFVIKDSNGNIVQKMSLSNYNHPASSISNANNIMFYATEWKTYTVYLKVDDLNYQELTLKVNEIEDFTIYDMDVDDTYVSEDNIALGDFAYIYHLERIGTYNLTFTYQGTQINNMLFVVFETNEAGEYVYKNSYEINKENNIIELNEVLIYSKNVLLCVFDSEGNGVLDISIEKEQSTEFSIYTDPTETTSGSEVRVNGGALNGTTMTQGFTRHLYLGEDAPDRTSRLNYSWYSLDESVAKVSAYGTITGVGVGTTTIQCVYKADSSIKATLVITVSDYIGTDYVYLDYGMDVRVGGTTSGTEVSSGKGNAIVVSENPQVTIHSGYTRLICLGDDSPTTSIQDFIWTSIDPNIASVSSFGTITANKTGTVTITGTYKYNPYYKVVISVEVIS